MADVRSRELGAYLRARRDRLSPADVGLPGGGGRRRVKGLRREEVAVLANVGSSWYTWLEQGRDVRPSAEVLAAIADALRLSSGERRHLFLLGGHPDAERLPSPDGADGRLQALLDSLAPQPAVVMNPWFEAVAYNAPFRFMIDDLEALPAADRNCAYLHFTHPDWIAGHSDHEQECAAVVAKLCAYHGESVTDPAWAPLLGRLREESPLFVRLWEQADVSTEPGRVKRIRSRHVGSLSVRAITMLLEENPAPVSSCTSPRIARPRNGSKSSPTASPAAPSTARRGCGGCVRRPDGRAPGRLAGPSGAAPAPHCSPIHPVEQAIRDAGRRRPVVRSVAWRRPAPAGPDRVRRTAAGWTGRPA